MLGTYILSLVLIGLSGVLLDLHRRTWRAVQEDTTVSHSDSRFFRSQYRRRTQASGIIGLLGVAIGLFPLVPQQPLPITIYLTAISAACMSIMLLGALDAWATRQNFARMRSEQLAAQIKLARELGRDIARSNDG